MLSEYLMGFNFQKIVQWALEYGLKDPKVRDFLIPFKRFIENYMKKHNDSEVFSDDYIQKTFMKHIHNQLSSTVEENKFIMTQLKKSNEELKNTIKGLEESKEKDVDMIRGLEESVDEWKKTIDEIYNSTTWKLVSKFTGGQTKRKKN